MTDVRSSLLLKGILPVIPPKANRKTPIACDINAYQPHRAHAQPLQAAPRIATRYDKTAFSFVSFLKLAASRLWLIYYVNRT